MLFFFFFVGGDVSDPHTLTSSKCVSILSIQCWRGLIRAHFISTVRGDPCDEVTSSVKIARGPKNLCKFVILSQRNQTKSLLPLLPKPLGN